MPADIDTEGAEVKYRLLVRYRLFLYTSIGELHLIACSLLPHRSARKYEKKTLAPQLVSPPPARSHCGHHSNFFEGFPFLAGKLSLPHPSSALPLPGGEAIASPHSSLLGLSPSWWPQLCYGFPTPAPPYHRGPSSTAASGLMVARLHRGKKLDRLLRLNWRTIAID